MTTFDGGGVCEAETGMAVWVQARKCDTCIFRPGNLMFLEEGRVKQMVEEAVAEEGHITCHDTLLYGQSQRQRPAICRGYFDHPQGNERSLALRLGRALGTIRYQLTTKERSVLLAELLADTGLTVTMEKGKVSAHSTGWVARDWKVTYHLGERSLTTEFQFGDVNHEPDLLEVFTQTLGVARLVTRQGTYEEWGRELGGDRPDQWPARELYDEQVSATRQLRQFLGGRTQLERYTEALGANTSEHQDQAPATLDALLPGHDVTRGSVAVAGVEWMVPDCDHSVGRLCADGFGPCTWRVLAVHRDRVREGGQVAETERGYQAVTPGPDGHKLHHPQRAGRELAIADVVRHYASTVG